MGQRWLDGYSAQVEIYLMIDGKRYDIAQIGNGTLILRDDEQIPPGTEAKLVILIDGHEEKEIVVLTKGAVNNEEPVPFF